MLAWLRVLGAGGEGFVVLAWLRVSRVGFCMCTCMRECLCAGCLVYICLRTCVRVCVRARVPLALDELGHHQLLLGLNRSGSISRSWVL